MLTISALTTATMTVLLTALSLNVSRLRLRYKVSFGHGTHRDLEMAVRAHGNTLEQILLFVALLMGLESIAPGHAALVPLAASFVVARCLHIIALFSRKLLLRQIAHLATVGLQLTTALLIGWRWSQV